MDIPNSTNGASKHEIGQTFVTSTILSLLTAAACCTIGFENPIAISLLTIALIPAYYLMILSCKIEGHTSLTLFSSMYIIYSLIIPGIIHSASNSFPFYRMSYPEGQINKAALIILLFNTFLLIGFITTIRKENSNQSNYKSFIIEPKFVLFGTFLVFISIAGFISVGPNKFLTVRRDIGSELAQFETLFAMSLVRFISFCSFALLAAAATARKSWSRSAYIPMAVAGGIFFLANYPLAIPRYVLFAYAIALNVLFLGLWKRGIKTIITLAYPALLTTIFPIMSTLSRGQRGNVLFIDPIEYYKTSGDFDGFQSTINVVNWIERDGVQGGKQLFSALFVFIPRQFWPEKALPTGSIAAKENGYMFTNISCPLPAEIFSDFGWPGVILGGLIIGYIFSSANYWATRAQARGNLSNLMTYALMAGYSTILLRGSLIAVISVCALAVMTPQILRLIEDRG